MEQFNYSNYDAFTNVDGGDYASDFLLGTNRLQQKENNALQLQLMKDQNAFSEYMSNTAYQRGVKDMELAGINPMINGGQSAQAFAPYSASANMNAPESELKAGRKQLEKFIKLLGKGLKALLLA